MKNNEYQHKEGTSSVAAAPDAYRDTAGHLEAGTWQALHSMEQKAICWRMHIFPHSMLNKKS